MGSNFKDEVLDDVFGINPPPKQKFGEIQREPPVEKVDTLAQRKLTREKLERRKGRRSTILELFEKKAPEKKKPTLG